MAIAPEPGMTAAEIKAANTAVNQARIANNAPAPVVPVVTPTSGAIPNFTPSVKMPAPAVEPGQPGFVGPVIPSTPVIPATPSAPVWKKAGTVITTQGPVDVDSTGKASDGTIPIAVSDANRPPQPGTGYDWDGSKWVKPPVPQDGKTYTWDDMKGWVPSELNTSKTTTQQVDSIAAVTALLSSYGIGDLGPAITAAVMKGYSTDTINLIMQDPNSNDPLAVAFQTRFPSNKARLAAGKSVLSPGEYLAAERTYTQILQSYGVANLATRDKLNQFIANDISATEVADRVNLAVNRVQNADAATKEALKQYYPMLNQADIVGAVLNPSEGLPALQRKITIGEIGGAALAQNLKDATGNINIAMGASTLADLGVTQAKAREGFATVAEVTPRGQFLSGISSTGQQYGQLQAEQEAFQGLASAKRARQALTAEEQARFQGSSGTARGAFSTGYLSKQASSGAF